MAKRKFYIFYKVKMHEPVEIYAFTENAPLAHAFTTSRNMEIFMMREKRFDDLLARQFAFENSDKMLFWNILSDREKSYEVPTTYSEDYKIGYRCDQIFDESMELQKQLLNIPFTEDIREALDFISDDMKAIYDNKDSKVGPFNTFQIFLDLFGETVLK
jgi:hypothetical protein